MNTRHLYTFQDGEIAVLEHITTIGTVTEGDEHRFFYVGIVGGTCIAAKDVEFEATVLKYNVDVLEGVLIKTTERAELIKALAAI
jgi:hypothetical protein